MATKSATQSAPAQKWDIEGLSDRALDLLIQKAQSIRQQRRQAARAQADKARAEKTRGMTLPALNAAVLKYGWTEGLRQAAERMGVDVAELSLHVGE
jgi:hypothetical protein